MQSTKASPMDVSFKAILFNMSPVTGLADVINYLCQLRIPLQYFDTNNIGRKETFKVRKPLPLLICDFPNTDVFNENYPNQQQSEPPERSADIPLIIFAFIYPFHLID